MIGLFAEPFPDNQRDKANRCGYRQGRDEMRTEPIIFLPLVQNHLKRTHSQREHGYSDVVNPDTPALYATEERRIFDQDVRQIKGKKDHGQRDEKYPAP